jgi:hypothetical protein
MLRKNCVYFGRFKTHGISLGASGNLCYNPLLHLLLYEVLYGGLLSRAPASYFGPHYLGVLHECFIEFLLRVVIFDWEYEFVVAQVLHVEIIADSLVLIAEGIPLLFLDVFVAYDPPF